MIYMQAKFMCLFTSSSPHECFECFWLESYSAALTALLIKPSICNSILIRQ